MSIVLSLCQNSQVAILTDGAVLNPDGTVAHIGQKILISQNVPVAVAARGDAYWAKTVAGLVLGWVEDQGFDKGMELLAKVLPEFAPKDLPYDIVELVVAGVSETKGAAHRVFVNVANGGAKPLTLIDPGPTCWLSLDTGTDESFERIGVRAPYNGELPGRYFLETGIRYMEFYRRFRGNPVPGSGRQHAGRYMFGGQVDLTMVDPTGAQTVTIHRWNDKIGEPIDPWKDQPSVVAFPGMNRQQRRAMKHAEREGRSA